MRTPTTLVSLALAATLLGGCAGASFSPGQLANDLTTTATIKTELAATMGMQTLTRVHIRTVEDRVYLTGRVTDDATAARIDTIARNIAGTNRVTNQLTVEGATATAHSD